MPQMNALCSLSRCSLSSDRVHCAPAARAALRQRWGGQSIRALSLSLSLSAVTKINNIKLEMRPLRVALRSCLCARSTLSSPVRRTTKHPVWEETRSTSHLAFSSMRTDDDDTESEQSARRARGEAFGNLQFIRNRPMQMNRKLRECMSVCVFVNFVRII